MCINRIKITFMTGYNTIFFCKTHVNINHALGKSAKVYRHTVKLLNVMSMELFLDVGAQLPV